MKKKLLIIVLLLFHLFGHAQTVQRMHIPKGQKITLDSGGTSSVNAICLDYFKPAPGAGASLNNILLNPDKATVTFTDNNQQVSLKSLLGKPQGISISGHNANINLIDRIRYNRDNGVNSSSLMVSFTNNTSRSLRIDLTDNIQVGDHPNLKSEPFYGDQDSQWTKEIEEYRKSLHFLGFDHPNIRVNVDKFRAEHQLKTKKAFENELAQLVNQKTHTVNKRNLDANIVRAFTNNKIGIEGRNATELLANYNLATKKNIQKRDIIDQVNRDASEGHFYQINENGRSNDKYIHYLKSKTTKGLLYRYSDYVLKYRTRIENNLTSKNIGEENVEILNFLDESEDALTHDMIRRFFPKNNTDFTLQSLGALKRKLKSKNIEYLFCLGHYEEGSIFTYAGPDEIKHSYSIKMLEDIADELGVKLFFIGCESSQATGGKTGTTVKVNSIKILEAISVSLDNSNNLKDFLGRLSKECARYGYQIAFEFDEHKGLVRIKVFDERQHSDGNYHEKDKVVIEYNLFNLFSDTNTVIDTAKDLEDYLDKQDKDENKTTKN